LIGTIKFDGSKVNVKILWFEISRKRRQIRWTQWTWL